MSVGVRLQFAKDAAGTLEFYPKQGRADAAADVYVYTSGTNELDGTNLAGSGNGSLDAASEALTASASVGDETVTVADISAYVVGRRYSLKSHEGRRQEVTLLGKTGTTLRLDQPVQFACTDSTSYLQGHRLTVSLTTAHTATVRRRLRVLWVYDVDSVTYRETRWIDIVRVPFQLSVTEDDLETLDPDFGEWAGDRAGWRKLEAGATAAVWSTLAAMQVYPDLVRDTTLLELAYAFKMLELFYFREEALSGRWREKYEETISQFRESRAWYDTDADLVADGAGDEADIDTDIYNSSAFDEDSETLDSGDEFGLPASYLKVG